MIELARKDSDEIAKNENSNMLVVAYSIGIGLGITAVPNLLDHTPTIFKSIFSSRIVSASVVAVILNAFLNHAEKTVFNDVIASDTIVHK